MNCVPILTTLLLCAPPPEDHKLPVESAHRTGESAFDILKKPYRTDFIEAYRRQCDYLKPFTKDAYIRRVATDNASTIYPARDILRARQKQKDTIQLLENLHQRPIVYMAGPLLDKLYVGAWGKIPKSTAKVVQVINQSEMRVDFRSSKGPVFLRGVPTKGLVDGGIVRINGYVEVIGTETYRTAIGGSNTVFVVEPLLFTDMLLSPEELKKLPPPPKSENDEPKEDREKLAMGKYRAVKLFHEGGSERLRDQYLEELLKEYPNTKGGRLAEEFMETHSIKRDDVLKDK